MWFQLDKYIEIRKCVSCGLCKTWWNMWKTRVLLVEHVTWYYRQVLRSVCWGASSYGDHTCGKKQSFHKFWTDVEAMERMWVWRLADLGLVVGAGFWKWKVLKRYLAHLCHANGEITSDELTVYWIRNSGRHGIVSFDGTDTSRHHILNDLSSAGARWVDKNVGHDNYCRVVHTNYGFDSW